MAFTTMALLALSLGGTAMSVYGQKKAGDAAKAAGAAAGAASTEAGLATQTAANDQAGLSDYNAAVADLQAKDAIDRGGIEENKFRAGVRGLVGQQRAGTAASNIDVGFGSPVDVNADAAHLGEIDALTIRTNAARAAWGYNVQGEDLRRQAMVTRRGGFFAAQAGATLGAAQVFAGNAAKSASNWGIATTLVGSGTSLLAQRYGYPSASGGGAGAFTTPETGLNHLEG